MKDEDDRKHEVRQIKINFTISIITHYNEHLLCIFFRMMRTMGMMKKEMKMIKQIMVELLVQKNYPVEEMERNLLN